MNHTTAGFWLFWLARIAAVTRVGCHTTSVLARVACVRRDDHAGADGAEVQQVDDDERARGAAQLVVIDGHRLFERDAHAREAVEIQRLGFARRQIVDVDAVLDRIDQALDVAAADLEFVALAGQQRRLAHPDEVRVEGARQRRTMIRVHQHVAARQIDFVLEHDGHGLCRRRPSPAGRRRW